MPVPDSPMDEESRKREARQRFEESIEHITREELTVAANMGEKKSRRLEDDVPSALEAVWQELQVLIAMVRDYVRGEYREIPFGSIAAVAAAVLYFVSPVDAIPDFIPGLGYIDDAAVIMACVRMVRSDMENYRQRDTVDAK